MKRFLRILTLMLAGMPLAINSATGHRAFVLKDVTVIDATGAAPKSKMTVVIADGRIKEVTPSTEVTLPENARVITATGKYLIPGLWDMHMHLSKAGENTLPVLIASGITSVRDMGGGLEFLQRIKREIEQGKRTGPRIKMAGPILESAANVERMKRDGGVEPVERFRVGVGAPEEADAVVKRLARKGVDFIKIRTAASVETYRAIAAAARKYHLPLAGHPSASPEDIIQAGQISIEHGFYPPLDDRSEEQRRDLYRKFADKGIAFTPTLVVKQAVLLPYEKKKAMVYDVAGKLVPTRKYLYGYLIDDWKEQLEEQKAPWPGIESILDKQVRETREMFQSGVRILPGTDTAVLGIWPGFSLHEELRLFVQQIGMSPMQAIISATRSPAEFFGMDDDLGTIEKGKLADLVLLDASPLEDIRNTQKISGVLRDGKWLSAADLNKELEVIAAQAKSQSANSGASEALRLGL